MRKNIFKIIVSILIYVAISIVGYMLLRLFGLNSVKGIRDFIFSCEVWAYIVFFFFQILVSTFICIIPCEDELLTLSALVLFGPIKGFLIASFNMFVTSSLQFVMGRYFCKGVLLKVFGDKSMQKYENCLNVKGEIMLPILYAIPLFPHDSLCVLAGMGKMKYWYFALVTLMMRSLEIASVCFLGSGIINFGTLRIIDWIILINVLIIDIYLIFKIKKYVENKINKG